MTRLSEDIEHLLTPSLTPLDDGNREARLRSPRADRTEEQAMAWLALAIGGAFLLATIWVLARR